MKMNRRNHIGHIAFAAATLFLILVITFCTTATVLGMTKSPSPQQESYYQEQEKALLKEIKSYLQTQGYHNSGVNLTRITDETNQRQYKITIHHAKIDRLEAPEQQLLLTQLSTYSFSEDNCSFTYHFF